MTEAGTQWLVNYIKENHPIPEYGNMVGAMEYGIRAFCAEVEKRYDEGRFRDIGRAFDFLKRELLGE